MNGRQEINARTNRGRNRDVNGRMEAVKERLEHRWEWEDGSREVEAGTGGWKP